MKRRILVLIPLFVTREDAENIRNDLGRYAWNGTEIDVAGLEGSIAVNSRVEGEYATPELLDLVVKAEKDGYDAVISYCYGDVGVDAGKELVDIPVLGPFETSVAVANMLGQKFSAVTVAERMRSLFISRLRDLELERNYVSTRGIGPERFFVFSADKKHVETMNNALMEEGRKALADGAQVLILACTGFPLAAHIKDELKVPLIDGAFTLKVAEALIDVRLGYSTLRTMEGGHSSGEAEAIKIRVKLLVPTSTSLGSESIKKLKRIANEGTEISVIHFEDGSKSIETVCDVAGAAPFIIREAANAVEEGFDAVVISSFEDPGIESAREVCDIPVVGTGESSMLLTCLLGRKFSVVTYDRRVHPLIEKMASKIGVEKRLQSVRSMDGEMRVEKLIEEVEEAIADGAEAVILGEADGQELVQSAQSRVKVPVLDPLSMALKMSEALHTLQLSHSKLAFPKPFLPDHHEKRLGKLKEKPAKLQGCMFIYG